MESRHASQAMRVLVAVRDDLLRDALVSQLTKLDEVDVIGHCPDARRALLDAERGSPDLFFLDRAMLSPRQLRGVRAMLARGRPLIAFVVTQPEPVEAFEPDAVDYVQLPATTQRTRTTIDRARQRLGIGEAARRRQPQPRVARSPRPDDGRRFLQRIPARTREGFRIIPIEELVSAVAHREYLHLTTSDGERHVILYALKDLQARLDPTRFIRLSRSTLVSLTFVRQVLPGRSGLLTVALSNGEHHDASRRRARELRHRLLQL